MKRGLLAVSLVGVLVFSAAPVTSQTAREATIQPETKARLVLQSQLNSKLSEVGDSISAVLYESIYVEGELVMPKGTEFFGRVTEVKPARRGQKNGTMSIIFDRVAMPWGEEPVSLLITAVDDWTNEEKLKADEEGEVSGNRDGERTAENVQRGGTIGGAGAGAVILIGGPGTGTFAAGGAGIAAGLLAGLLMTKGGEVRLQPGAMFRVKFVKPLTLPVVRQRRSAIDRQPTDGSAPPR